LGQVSKHKTGASRDDSFGTGEYRPISKQQQSFKHKFSTSRHFIGVVFTSPDRPTPDHPIKTTPGTRVPGVWFLPFVSLLAEAGDQSGKEGSKAKQA
jgi:hypothetical protein